MARAYEACVRVLVLVLVRVRVRVRACGRTPYLQISPHISAYLCISPVRVCGRPEPPIAFRLSLFRLCA